MGNGVKVAVPFHTIFVVLAAGQLLAALLQLGVGVRGNRMGPKKGQKGEEEEGEEGHGLKRGRGEGIGKGMAQKRMI